ncbi:MAG: hypothetical protein ACYC66_08825 [Chloroflexota bacterium]
MRKATLTLLATLAVAIMFVLSTAVAMAGWGYDDCPPASYSAWQHASDQAKANWVDVHPNAADNAWYWSNPGNKGQTK